MCEKTLAIAKEKSVLRPQKYESNNYISGSFPWGRELEERMKNGQRDTPEGWSFGLRLRPYDGKFWAI